MSTRTIRQRVPAYEVTEGAGVTVHRSIGTPALRKLDPFLLLDHFVGATHTHGRRLARVLHLARYATHCVACWRLQAHAEKRHQTRQDTGGIAGLTGGNTNEQTP